MLPSRGLRWAGAGISNGRQRLILRGGSTRNFSINSTSASSPRFPRVSPYTKSTVTSQQSRSLSLFGWGGTSKSSPDPTSNPSSSTDVEIGPSTAGLDNVRTIKASHATSDAPDPTQTHLHLPNKIEPQIVEDLQEKITLPHGAAADRITEVINGETDITAAAERMGYLKEVCGLDFGWGPSSIMENLLEALHVYGGLGWTASIIAVATILRVAMIYPIIGSQIQGKKMREVQPYVAPIREKYMALMKAGDKLKAAELAAEMKEINKSAGVSYSKAFVPLLIQLPFSFGAFRVLRNAGQLPVPAFVTEDWLWTTDLSFSDPYYLTPLISSATIYMSFKLQQKGQTTMFGPQMMKIMGIALPAMSFVFMSFQPGAVQLYFMTTGIWAFGTTALIRQQWFRDIVKLGPLPTGPAAPAKTPTLATKPQQDLLASKKLPSNIQRIVPTNIPTPRPAETENKSDPSRSIIDRAVDNVKGQWSDLKSSTTSSTSVFGSKMADREKQAKQQASARYHATRQKQLEAEREERNQQARGY